MNRWRNGMAAAVALLAGAYMFSPAMAGSDIGEFPSCAHCGMDRQGFDYSRMLVVYEDGASVGTCSLACAEKELSGNRDRKVRAVKVADYGTRQLLDAEKAVWVVGGKRQGVMTRTPKWAFAGKAGAEAFVKEYGGTLATWTEALKAAAEERAGEKAEGKAPGEKGGCCCCGK